MYSDGLYSTRRGRALSGYVNPIDPKLTGDNFLAADLPNVYEIAPQFGGRRHWGTNIVPRVTDTGNYRAVGPANQYDLTYDFCVEGTSGAAWVWIKMQIDRIRDLGGTFVRWFMDASAYAGDATHHGVATWRGTVTTLQLQTAIANLCTYLASQGMFFYATAMEAAQTDTNGALTALPGHPITNISVAAAAVITCSEIHYLSTGQTTTITGSNSTPTVDGTRTVTVLSPTTFSVAVTTTIAGTTGTAFSNIGGLRLTEAQICAMIDTYVAAVALQPNVLGCDVLMEFSRSDWAMAGVNLTTVMNRAKVARGRSVMPLTCSLWAASGTFAGWDALMTQAAIAGVEYFDLHVYTLSPGALLSPYVINKWGLPCMIGETGITQNGHYFLTGPQQNVVHPYAIELRAQHYQDVIASMEANWYLQVMTNYGAATEWLTDDGQDWDFTQHAEMYVPWQTATRDSQLYTRTRTLPIGADTTVAAFSSGTTFMLGWGMADFANKYSISSSRVKRANASFSLSVIDLFDLPSVDQAISVDFLSSDAVPSGGQIVWTLSLRHTAASLTNFYFALVNSQSAVPASDGVVSIYRFFNGGFTLVATGQIAALPMSLTPNYRLSFSASGVFPTTLTAVLTNVTTSTVLLTVSGTDAHPNMQVAGFLGLPSHIGDVYYTNVQLTSTGNVGPSVVTPTIGAITSTSVALTWSVVGGTSPYRSIPEWIPLNASKQPTGLWTALPSTTGTSATVTGITPLTVDYAFRIRVIDSAPVGIAA